MAAVLTQQTHLRVRQGRRNQWTFFLKQESAPTLAFNLTGYGGACHFRAGPADFAPTIIATATVAVINAATGELSVTIEEAAAELITRDRGTYDVKITNGSDSQTAAAGTWSLTRQTTVT